ncbi:MAG: bifunctional adenosylcobinamide kinase/adenosylcobinamide-phosphate guanylyltransferase [Bacillota bacterium]|nr:bifunctional adenosylcobinamide kinase/adenosylcobinamide-phosphate guanylyltransferase [Bacillota bacterium]
MSRIILISGGIRSGKSTFAESLFQGHDDVLYIATAKRTDGEMDERITRHRARRNSRWLTHEGFCGLGKVVRTTACKFILLDCCSFWFANLLFHRAGVDLDGNNITPVTLEKALQIVRQEIKALIDAVRMKDKTLAIVTNEVGWGLVSDHPLGRLFCDLTGLANQYTAQLADEVYLMSCGLPLKLK